MWDKQERQKVRALSCYSKRYIFSFNLQNGHQVPKKQMVPACLWQPSHLELHPLPTKFRFNCTASTPCDA